MNREQYDAAIRQVLEETVERLLPHGAGHIPEVRLRAALDVMAKRVAVATRAYELLNLLDTAQLAEQWGVSERRVRAHVAALHERFGVGREVHGRWMLTAEEAETHRPGPPGNPNWRAPTDTARED